MNEKPELEEILAAILVSAESVEEKNIIETYFRNREALTPEYVVKAVGRIKAFLSNYKELSPIAKKLGMSEEEIIKKLEDYAKTCQQQAEEIKALNQSLETYKKLMPFQMTVKINEQDSTIRMDNDFEITIYRGPWAGGELNLKHRGLPLMNAYIEQNAGNILWEWIKLQLSKNKFDKNTFVEKMQKAYSVARKKKNQYFIISGRDSAVLEEKEILEVFQ